MGKTIAESCWLTAYAWEHPTAIHPYWWLAPTYNQVRVGFRYIVMILRTAGVMAGEPVHSPFPRVKLVNGSSIEFRSWEREQNLMGDPIAGGVVDEAGLLTPSAQAAISSRRSSTMGPLHYIGNPGIVSGPFRRLCSLGEQAGADPQSEWRGIYSLHRWTWRDKYEALKLEDPAKAELYLQFIEQERASLPEFEFRRLYEAVWVEDEAAIFRNIDACTKGAPLHEPATDDTYTIGVDVGQRVDYLVAIGIGRKSGRADFMERFRGVPAPQQADRLEGLLKEFPGQAWIETNGPGLPLFQEMQKRGAPVQAFETTGKSKPEIITHLASELEHERLPLADMPPLQHELRMFRYHRLPSGTYRYEAPAGEHDDTVMALAIAAWAHSHKPNAGLLSWMERQAKGEA